MSLEELRGEINEADAELLRAFEKRMAVSAKIAAWKQQNGKPITDAAREQAVIQKQEAAASSAIRPYVRSLYDVLFQVGKDYQQKCMENQP